MGKKKKQNSGGEQEEFKKEKGGDENSIIVVLKTDLHCEGCASKLVKSIRSVDGVNTVMIGDRRKITVVGDVDPAELRETVEQKTHQKAELIVSPQLKVKADSSKAKGDGGKENNKNESKDKKSNEKYDQTKSKEKKEAPVTTAVLKVNLHCDGCVERIYKTVTKSKGFQDIKIDHQKDLVTVTGAMDMKGLAELLQKQLKKNVEIVPPKKEPEKKGKGGGGGDEENMEGNRAQAQMFGYPYPLMYGSGAGDPFGQFQYGGPYAVGPYHAPQMFSDENPNACTVM